jgi:hypothetical protein
MDVLLSDWKESLKMVAVVPWLNYLPHSSSGDSVA